VYSQSRLTTLDTLSSTIASNAVPSIEYLGRGGVRLQRLRQLIYDEVTFGHSRATIDTADVELKALDEDVAKYVQITPLPGELDLWTALRRDLGEATGAARAILQALERGDRPAAASLLKMQASPAFERASNTMLAAMEFDVRQSERLAREVQSLRREATQNIIVLDSLATIIAAVAAFFVLRADREHEQLQQRHNALLTDRLAELDRFAGRVAHDILSPLGTVGFGLALLSETAGTAARPHIERSQRAVQRVQQLVDGLLRFARAGAQIDAGAGSPVNAVLNAVAADCAEAAKSSGVDLIVEPSEPVDVGCSVGVLTSMVQNLAMNAIKYMDDRPVKKVVLRSRAAAGRVRIEVEDSGPGIAPQLQQHIFEAFVRGTHKNVSGLGLGLATVKRLVEAHGGTVGVRSHVGSGTLFVIDLPRASD
jgi:signal transduction histidine kinase